MNKFIKYTLAAFLVLFLTLGAFSGGFVVGHFTSTASATGFSLPGFAGFPGIQSGVATPTGAAQATPADLQTLFKPFWETWDLVHKIYVDQPVDNLKLMQGAISGMLNSLGDKHTTYMNPQMYKDATSELVGSFEGIGAYVDLTGDFLKITKPIAGSPAEKAGLQPGDLIVAIDGNDMTGVDPEAARQKVLGPAGSVVTLTIKRDGVDKPFDVKVTRAKINVPSVESKMLANNIAYIQLNTFGTTTGDELKSALKDLLAKNPKGLIFDLRNNGGGYLNTAVEVASQFVSTGVIVSEKYGDGKIDTSNAIPGGLATNIPMIVLVNENTASASEVVAGALQDYGRAKLVGVVTYGKGSVQNWVPLSDNQGAARITIAKWLTPKNRTIDKLGLTPDIVVPMSADDYKNGLDPQLDAAVKAMLAMLK